MKKKDYSDLWRDVRLKDILKPDLLEKYKKAGAQTTGDLITYLMDAYSYHSRNANWAKAHNRLWIATAIFIVIFFIANLVAVYEVYYKIPELLTNVQQMLEG